MVSLTLNGSLCIGGDNQLTNRKLMAIDLLGSLSCTVNALRITILMRE